MTGFDIDTVLGWRGNTVRASNGEKIGTVGDVFLDRETDRPAWIGVRTGWFGTKESYVPVAQAHVSADEIHVPYGAEQVKSAPQIDPDVSLDAAEEEALYRHYGMGETTREPESTTDEAVTTGEGGDAPLRGREMIRSEEEVRLGHIERRPTERVRIKKVLVTDHVKQVVPVRREVIQLEHEPAPPGEIESSEVLPERP